MTVAGIFPFVKLTLAGQVVNPEGGVAHIEARPGGQLKPI